MKQVTLTIEDNKYPFLIELVNNLDFVKKVETSEGTENKKILNGLKQAVEEVKLVKAGKLKPRPLK